MAAPLTPPHSEPAPATPIYVLAFADLAATLKRSPDEFIARAEDLDLSGPESEPTRLLIACPLALVYLSADDLPPARHALQRLPPALAAHALAHHTRLLLASVWERRYANVYARAQVLAEFVAAGAGFGFGDADRALAELVAAVLATFVDTFRNRTFELVSSTYTSIPLSLAQSYLGLPADRLIAETAGRGWSYDSATQIFKPGPSAQQSRSKRSAASQPSSVATFGAVADGVTQLESIA